MGMNLTRFAARGVLKTQKGRSYAGSWRFMATSH